jgi:hypothetical protein
MFPYFDGSEAAVLFCLEFASYKLSHNGSATPIVITPQKGPELYPLCDREEGTAWTRSQKTTDALPSIPDLMREAS